MNGNVLEQVRLATANMHRMKVHTRCEKTTFGISNARYDERSAK